MLLQNVCLFVLCYFRGLDRVSVWKLDWHSDGGWNEGMDRLPQTPSFPITMTPKLRYVKVIRRWGPWRWGWNLPRWPRLDFGVVIVVMVWVEISGCDNWKRSTTLAIHHLSQWIGGGGRAWTYLQLPLRQWGCQKCLPLCVVLLKGKHYRKPHCRNGVKYR